MTERAHRLAPPWRRREASGLGGLLARVSEPAAAGVPLVSDARGGASWHRVRGLHALVLAAVLFNLWSLRSERLSVAYPNDSAMHLQMTTLASKLLDHSISPWDHWYPLLSLGSPFFVQYQSASAVLTGALALLGSTSTTFAWSLYLLLSLWPLCVYWSARLLSWERWESAIAAALAPLIFTVTGRGFGHQSYVWLGSGLWSQLWAMWTLPLAWAFSWRYISQRKSLFLAVLFLALTIVFHFLTAYLAALSLVVWVLIRPSQLRARGARALLLGTAALMSTAWVTVPLALHARWLAVNQFQVGTTINDSYGARRVLSWLLTGQIYDWRRLPVMTVLVVVGLVVCLRRWRHDERARAVVGVWVLSLLLFFGRPTLRVVINLLPGNQNLLLQRYVMGLHLAGLVLAGVGLVAVGREVSRRFAPRAKPLLGRWPRGVLASPSWRAAILVAVVVALLSPAWTQIWTYDHYSALWIKHQRGVAGTQGADVNSLAALAETRGGGRIYAGMPSNWGHHFYVGAVPVYIYLEQLGVDAVGFTLRTSGLMTDPEAYFDEYDAGDYAAFGVHYLILPVGHAPPVLAQRLRTAGLYRLWRVGDASDSALIQVVDTYGVLRADLATLGGRTSGFLRSAWPGRAVYPTVSLDGSAGAAPTLTSLSTRRGDPGRVVRESHDLLYAQSAAATVETRRSAVVLLKVAYDPGWTARVDGRRAPTIMLAPALLGVRVPSGRHVVQFQYQGFRYYALLDAVALSTLIAVALGPWWLRRRARAPSAELN